LRVAKTARITGRKSGAVHLAIGEGQRHGEVIRHALFLQFAQHGKVQWAVFVTETTANGNAAVYDAPYRTVPEILRLECFEWGAVHIYGRAFLPQKALAHDVGM